jgi:hypothetical protein
MGFVLNPIVVQGAVLGRVSDAVPLVTCTDCCAPNTGIIPRNNTPMRINLDASP